MPRTKIKRVKIANEKMRKATLKRRVDNLYKKAYELSMLCGSTIFIVVHYNKEGLSTLWPSEELFYAGLTRFMNLPERERAKKIVMHLDFLEGSVNDMAVKLLKIQKNKEEDDMEKLLSQLMKGMNVNGVETSKFDGLNSHIDEKLMKLLERMREHEKQEGQSPLSHDHPYPQPFFQLPGTEKVIDGQTSGISNTSDATLVEDMTKDDWFLETMADMNNNFSH